MRRHDSGYEILEGPGCCHSRAPPACRTVFWPIAQTWRLPSMSSVNPLSNIWSSTPDWPRLLNCTRSTSTELGRSQTTSSALREKVWSAGVQSGSKRSVYLADCHAWFLISRPSNCEYLSWISPIAGLKTIGSVTFLIDFVAFPINFVALSDRDSTSAYCQARLS